MVEMNKKQKRSSVSEEDISNLLQKYTATTVLALLQEVAQSPGAKLNWDALVKKTSTGISNAREYQMLWRHLAYRDALLDKLDDGAEPLDDDSDLDSELEPFPSVTSEASAEAAACVKVLIASGLPSDSSLPNNSTVEAPLTINIPDGQSNNAPQNAHNATSSQGMNITVPVSVPKQNPPTVPSTGVSDGNLTPGGNLTKRKRKAWSESEDKELIAAVQKFGVGNWATISRGNFKGDRTAAQLQQLCSYWHSLGDGSCCCIRALRRHLVRSGCLGFPVFPGSNPGNGILAPNILLSYIAACLVRCLSRWNIIRKKHGNVNLDGEKTSHELSEAQLATRSALFLALDMPNKTAVGTNASALKIPSTGAVICTSVEVSGQNQSLSVQGPVPKKPFPLQKPSPVGRMGIAANSRATVKKTSGRSCPTTTTDAILATAVAAGARIASPKTAASLLKVAQSKNAVRVMTSGNASVRPPVPGSPKQLESNSKSAAHVTSSSSVPSDEPLSARPPNTSNTLNLASIKSVSATAGCIQSGSTPQVTSTSAKSHGMSSEHRSAPASSLTIRVPKEPEVKGSQELQSSKTVGAIRDQGQENGACEPRNGHVDRVEKHKISPVLEPTSVEGKNLKDENKLGVSGDQIRLSHRPDDNMDCSPNGKSENPLTADRKSSAQSVANKPSEAGIVTDESCGNRKATCESKAANGT